MKHVESVQIEFIVRAAQTSADGDPRCRAVHVPVLKVLGTKPWREGIFFGGGGKAAVECSVGVIVPSRE